MNKVILILIIFALILILTEWLYVNWATHLYMTDTHSRIQEWIGYKKFKEKFDSVDWCFYDMFPRSLFKNEGYLNNTTKLHASIFMFDNIGYKLYPISYLMANRLIKKYIENIVNNKVEK